MSGEDALEQQLRPGATGTVEVDLPRGRARIDVVTSGPVGVEVERVRVTRDGPVDVVREAERLSRRLERHLDEDLAPSEVDPRLGGAVLRTRPEQVRDREFYELEIEQAGEVELRRKKGLASGGWGACSFPLTRRRLGRLLDELSGDED